MGPSIGRATKWPVLRNVAVLIALCVPSAAAAEQSSMAGLGLKEED
jgi:hypothetical protein